MFRSVRMAALILLLLACACGICAAAKAAWVIPGTLNVRKGPSLSAAKVGELTKGQKVTVTAFRDDGWCRATLPNGRTGWVKEEHLQFTAPARGAASGSSGATRISPKPAWVAAGVANLREGASISSSVAAQVKSGEKVYVIAKDGSWLRVKCSNGKRGWIRTDLLRFSPGSGGGTGQALSLIHI